MILPDAYLIEELNVHLNSYYINLRGSLDNLAWALNYQFTLVEADEDGRKRNECNLFGKTFLKALRGKRPALQDALESYKNWALELKNLRDPVAHRVPLSVIGGCLTSDNVAKFDQLMAKAAAPETGLEGQPRSYFVRQAHSIARFEPLLVISGPDGLEAREISSVSNDQGQFLALATRIVAEFSAPSSVS